MSWKYLVYDVLFYIFHRKVKDGMKEEVQQIREKNKDFAPGLSIVQVYAR